jgi:hypothetical protein
MAMTIDDLKKEIAFRKDNRDIIHARLRDFCQKAYGIADFPRLARNLFGDSPILTVCLSRQIPTANVEHVALRIFAQWLSQNGLECDDIPISFLKDSFTGSNKYKKSLVNVPFIARSRKGTIFCHCENILSAQEKKMLDGRIFESLMARDDVPVSEFHYRLREAVFGGSVKRLDVSDFFLSCLRESLQNRRGCPVHVWVDCDGRERKVSTNMLNGHQVSRPPAEWYYLLYLMLYLDGDRAMVSTVDDNPVVSRWFSNALEKIKSVTGFAPLLVDIPCQVEADGFRSDLNHVNKRLLEGGWMDNVSLPPGDLPTFLAFESLEKQVIRI